VVECLKVFDHVGFFLWRGIHGGFLMLVLSRKNQESVVVGGSGGFERVLKVTVLDINRGTVKLGFEVDREIPVHRLEVWERMCVGGPDSPKEGPVASAVG
jgi:carbon storage regulator CsrA